MPEMHLMQSKFAYTACGPFTKIKKEWKYFKNQGIKGIFIKIN